MANLVAVAAVLGAALTMPLFAAATASTGEKPVIATSTASKAWRTRLLVRTPMRDGTELVSHIFLPATPGPHPALLERTAYGISSTYLLDDATYWAARGYAYVVQDVRGRGDSDGIFSYYRREADDGYDMVEWIAGQPWSSGRVGLIGASYGAAAIWYAAAARPPHLACMNADIVTIQPFEEVPYQGGAFRLDWGLTWPLAVTGRQWHHNAVLGVNWNDVWGHRPIRTLDERAGQRIGMYREMLDHPTLDDYWRAISIGRDHFAAMSIPTLSFTGWVDGSLSGTSYLYRGLRRWSRNPAGQHIVIGPWPHATAWDGGAARTKVGKRDFGPASLVDARAIKLAFFDHCLAQRTASFDQPGARLFVTGADTWLSAGEYPLPGTAETSFYLGAGRTMLSAPGARGGEDRYRYDPENPVPAYVGTVQRSDALVPGEIHFVDHAAFERRADVLTYTSDVLTAPVTALGEARVELWAASDGPDTDFVAKLIDVQPDGQAVMIGSKAVGVIRARYRNGFERPVPLTPGKPEKFTIKLMDMGHRFLPGHRIRIHISSSAYPWIDPNPNTGENTIDAVRTRVAQQRILFGANHASRLVLSTITSAQFDAARDPVGPPGPAK